MLLIGPEPPSIRAPRLKNSQTMTMGENSEPTNLVPNCWIRKSAAMMAIDMPTILAGARARRPARVSSAAAGSRAALLQALESKRLKRGPGCHSRDNPLYL